MLRNMHGGVQDTGLSFESPQSNRTASRLGSPGTPLVIPSLLIYGAKEAFAVPIVTRGQHN